MELIQKVVSGSLIAAGILIAPLPIQAATANATPSIAFQKASGLEVTAKYVAMPKSAWVSILWQDGQGYWNEVGQRNIKAGNGKVTVLITGVDPQTGAAPTGNFKFRVQRTDVFGWSVDSAPFTLTTVAAPTCALIASNYYPGDVGTRVTLRWSSTNADYAKATVRQLNSSVTTTIGNHLKPKGKTVVQPDTSVEYVYTFYGKGGSASCSVTLGYKG